MNSFTFNSNQIRIIVSKMKINAKPSRINIKSEKIIESFLVLIAYLFKHLIRYQLQKYSGFILPTVIFS